MTRLIRSLLFSWIAVASVAPRLCAQAGVDPGPPLPYKDAGACPFEGCSYRNWVALREIAAHTQPDSTTPVAFLIEPKEHVDAITGTVWTVVPGKVNVATTRPFKVAYDTTLVWSPSDTLYLLTYQGEGFSKIWFKGKLYTDVDITSFYTDECIKDARSCGLALLQLPVTAWWARVRNEKGQVGWVLIRGYAFGNMDALGG